jgi:NAD(P)H dehydrogenase (quinone)
MRHLIIVAHPKKKSFTHAIAEAYSSTLVERGHRVACRDLYALKFNPVLSARDLAAMARGRAARDVRAEQAALRRAEVLTLIAPLWWSGFPAMLKGYVERVFVDPFLAALSGKKCVIITTAGATVEELKSAGTLRALRIIRDDGMVEFCGMTLVRHLILGGVLPGMSRAQGDRYLETVRRFARRAF